MKTDIKYLAIFSAIILATQLEAAQATRPGIQAPKPRHIISGAQIHLRAAPRLC